MVVTLALAWVKPSFIFQHFMNRKGLFTWLTFKYFVLLSSDGGPEWGDGTLHVNRQGPSLIFRG